MSSFEFTDAVSWGGRPVARRIANAQARQRVVVTGTIDNAQTITLGSSLAYSCVLKDGTGELDLVFVGRHTVPGMIPGARCTVEGTARMIRGRLELWNPLYRFEHEPAADGHSPAAGEVMPVECTAVLLDRHSGTEASWLGHSPGDWRMQGRPERL
jgi:RecG-like helicase